MAEQSFFDKVSTHVSHVPDVLSCIANLSNDEVFTPPEVVNNMLDLLPPELFANPNTTFLDPATKTGVFLREIAKRCLDAQLPGYKERSTEISEKKTLNIPLDEYDLAFEKQLKDKIDHIFHKQLYGIGITELTSLLARRSLYCSKYPNGPYSITLFDDAEGNIRFRRTEHVWKNGKCVWCGAAQNQYDRDKELESHAYEFIHTKNVEDIFKMKFDVIISNPPYQLSDGGAGASAKPIYHYFIEKAKKLSARYITMIIPARWYAGGKGLDDFRNEMLNDTHIRLIDDYPNPKDCFPGINVSGGVCYFLWDKNYDGDCIFTNIIGNEKNTEKRKLNEFNFFVRYNSAVSIIHKVKNYSGLMLDTIISSRKPFGLDSFVRGHAQKQKEDYTLVSSAGRAFISKSEINQGYEYINKYKVIIGKALSGHLGETDENGQVKVLAKVELLQPEDVCTESYLCVGNYDNKIEAENLASYLKTKFCRFLLLQALSSMNITKDKFCYVPLLDFSHSWSDDELYKKFDLSNEEISFIESMIKQFDSIGGDEE